ncbi:hypothetical protein, partial [Candidatus Harpocratesius sp.]
FLYSVVKNNRIELSSNMPYFDIDELNLQKNRYTECVISLRIIKSTFLGGVADFSMFTNCTEISIQNCNLQKIVAWPPNIKKIKLSTCKNLRSIPVEGTHYQFLKEIFFSKINLENWNIDFKTCFNLNKITIYGPIPNVPTLPPFTKIPQNWALCFTLDELNLRYLNHLNEIPIEFAFMPNIQISICDCSNFPNLSFLPVDFWTITEVIVYSDRLKKVVKKLHPRALKNENRELYERFSKKLLVERDFVCLDDIRWSRERIQYMKYVESMIPKLKDPSLQKYIRSFVCFWRPRITLNNDFDIFL